MVDIVQVVQAARHTTLVTVEIGLKAQIVKVSSFFFTLTEVPSRPQLFPLQAVNEHLSVSRFAPP